MKAPLETIRARDIIVRDMSGRKCDLVNTGNCPINKKSISKNMIDLKYYDDYYCYIPENFCRGLAAKFLYENNDELFNPQSLRCVRYVCGHICKSGDGNHRMCVLGHLDEEVTVEMITSNSICPDCEKFLKINDIALKQIKGSG